MTEAAVAQLSVLGWVVVQGARTAADLRGERQRRAVAGLVDAGRRGASAERLADVVWEDSDRPADPTPHVRTVISRLRRQLASAGLDASAVVESMPGGYRLGSGVEVDAWRFEELLSDGTGDDPAARLVRLDEALGLWMGPPFGELATSPVLAPVSGRLTELRLAAEEERIDAWLERGSTHRALGRGLSLVEEHPYRERLHRGVALALYRLGRQVDALRLLNQHRELILDELGLDPSGELTALEHAILNHDPRLRGPVIEDHTVRGYRLLEMISRSSTTERHVATQLTLDRPVAVAIGRTDDVAFEDVRRFHDEAGLLAQTRHPHLAQIVDHWREPTATFVVSEVPERTLADALAAEGDPAQRAVWAVQVAAGLAALHELGLSHGSVSAATIVLNEESAARLDLPDLVAGSRGSPEDDVRAVALLTTDLLRGATSAVVTDDEPLVQFLRDAASSASPPQAASFLQRLSELVGVAAPSVIEPDRAPNPYPGLSAFDEKTAGAFHGRDAFVHELAERCAGASGALTVVTGPSGSGKSSAVFAGLVPVLRAAAASAGQQLLVVAMRPGSDPFARVADAIGNVATIPQGTAIAPPDRAGSLDALVEQAVGPGVDVVLVIDQLEELFVLAAADRASVFLHALSRVGESKTGNLRIVATLRADFFDRALATPAFASAFRTAVVPLAPMTEDELADAIVLPARTEQVELEAQLVARLLADAGGRAGTLPLLGLTLHELFVRRTGQRLKLADYDELGGLSGALISRAEEVVANLGETELPQVRRLFWRIVTIDADHRPVRRSARLADLLETDISATVIDRFVAARLLTADRDPVTREPVIAVSHESVLESWPRLASWLEEDRRLLYEHGQLASAATAWDRDDRDDGRLLRGGPLDRAHELDRAGVRLTSLERELLTASDGHLRAEALAEHRHAVRRRRLLALTSVVAVVALVAGTVALRAQRRADDEAATAQRAAADSMLAAQEAIESAREADEARTVAADERDRATAASAEATIRLLQQAALTSFDDRPELGIQFALAALEAGGGTGAESTLNDLLSRPHFDRYLGRVEVNRCASPSPLAAEPALSILGQVDPSGAAPLSLWNLDEGGELATVSVPASSTSECPALAPGGTHVAAVSKTTVVLVDLTTGDEVARRDLGFEPERITWALDGSAIAALNASGTGSVEILRPSDLDSIALVELEAPFPIALALTSSAGALFVSSDARPPIRVDVAPRVVTELEGTETRIIELTVSPDGSTIVGTDGRRLLAWDGSTGDLISMAELAGEVRGRASLSLNPDASRVATLTDQGVEVWEPASDEGVREPIPYVRGIGVVSFVDDNSLVATAGGGRIYRLRALGVAARVAHDGVRGAIVAADGRAAATVGEPPDLRSVVIDADGTVALDLGSMPLTHRPFGDGLVAVYESEQKRYRVWSGGEVIAETSLTDVIMPNSVDGRSVRIGHGLAVLAMRDRDGGPPDDNEIVVLDAAHGDVLAAWSAPDDTLAEPLWPDRLLISSIGDRARITDLAGNLVHDLGRHEHPVESAALAFDGDLLLGLGDGSVLRYDATTLELASVQLGPPSNVISVLPFDGGFVAHHITGEIVKWLDGEPAAAGTLYTAPQFAGFGAISDDGRVVYIPDGQRVVELPLVIDAWIEAACGRAGGEVDEAAWEAVTGTSRDGHLTLCA